MTTKPWYKCVCSPMCLNIVSSSHTVCDSCCEGSCKIFPHSPAYARHRVSQAPLPSHCGACEGRGYFEEPTNFIESGVQRITCCKCHGTGRKER